MNIQIFGTKKNFDSKKAERYFKERGVKYQFIDMREKGLSKGEFQSVCQAVGGYDKLIDTNSKDKDLLALITYIAEEDRAEKILEKSEHHQSPSCKKWKTGNGRISARDLEKLEIKNVNVFKMIRDKRKNKNGKNQNHKEK